MKWFICLLTAGFCLLALPAEAVYMTATDSGTYIDVTMDGIYARFHYNRTDGSSDAIEFFEIDDDTEYAKSRSYLYNGSSTYSHHRGNIGQIIENTSNRVVIRIFGQLARTDNGDLLTNNTSVEIYFTVYPDRIFMHFTMDNTATHTFSTGSSPYYTSFLGIHRTAGSNPSIYVESGGSEVATTDDTAYDPASYDYVVSDGTEITGQVILLEDNSGAGLDLYVGATSSLYGCVIAPDGSWDSGVTSVSAVLILDSRDRAGSNYTEANRITMGNQYNDQALSIATGTTEANLHIPDSIDASGFAADGAWHFAVDGDNQTSLTWDTTRIAPAVAVHDFPLMTGSTPDEHLIGHWRSDDNAASSTVLDVLGVSDGNWEVSSSRASRDTSNDTSTDAKRGSSLDTKDLYSIDLPKGAGTVHDNSFLKKGSITITFKPNFSYDTADTHQLFMLHRVTDFVDMSYRSAGDNYRFRTVWGGITAQVDSSAYTSDAALQQWTTMHFWWDSDEDTSGLAINGVAIGVSNNAGTPTTSEPTGFWIGSSDINSEADYMIDEIKTYNTTVRPYGSYFTGNSAVDADVAHSDITFYWNAEEMPTTTYATGTGGVTSQIGDVTLWASHDSYDMVSSAGVYGNCADQTTRNQWFNPVLDNTDANLVLPGDKGSVSMWAKRTHSTTTMTLLSANNSTLLNNIRLWHNDSVDYMYLYIYDSTGEVVGANSGGANSPFVDENWHHVLMNYDNEKGTAKLIVDGVTYIDVTTTPWLDITWGGELSFSHYAYSFGYLDEIFITNNPNTPQNWTAGYKPVWQPLLEK